MVHDECFGISAILGDDVEYAGDAMTGKRRVNVDRQAFAREIVYGAVPAISKINERWSA